LGPDGLVEKDTKTHQSRRVALDGSTVAPLIGHREATDERASVCGMKLTADAFVLSSDVEGRASWYPDSVSRSLP
jgi:hypothetical protein